MGYFSIRSEAKYQVAEKRANMGIMMALQRRDCKSFNETGIGVNAVSDEGYNNCFIWSKGEYMGAKVIKTTVFPTLGWAGMVYRRLNTFELKGSGAIVACDNNCIIPALITGNKLNIPDKLLDVCKSNVQGLASLFSQPYFNDPQLLETDLTSKLFKAQDRIDLLTKLSSLFKLNFNSNGAPVELASNVNVFRASEDCTASGNKIQCGTVELEWNGIAWVYGTTSYEGVDLSGYNLTIKDGTFIGGGYISAKIVEKEKKQNQ